MENQTLGDHVLLLEGLKLTHSAIYPVVILLVLVYITSITSNLGLLLLISTDRTLHQPMYILLCSLLVNGMLFSSLLVPRLLKDIMTAASERYISYIECVIQAFGLHVNGTMHHTILMIMAFDRYVAICHPLRYAAIMNDRMVVKLTVSAWGVTLLLVGILFNFTTRLARCRRVIMNPYCDNASIFKLSCGSVLINNIYGLAYATGVLGSSICSITLTYLKIAVVCLRNKNSSRNSKALSTCSAHLLVYIIMLTCVFTIITLHRLPRYTYLRKIGSLLVLISPCLNPIIYGLQTKEIKHRILRILKTNKVTL